MVTYWRVFVGCGDLDAPLPRKRHEFPEISIADHS